MSDGLNKLKQQLSEVVSIVNSFKSEAVQLKVVDLLSQHLDFGNDSVESSSSYPSRTKRSINRVLKKRRSSVAKNEEKKGARKPAKFGAQAVLDRLMGEGFFKSKRTMKDIIEHCDRHLAKKIKPTALSGKLARAVRNKKLKREKNKEKQYEYFI